LKPLKEIIQNEGKSEKGAREVQQQVEDAEEILNPDNSSSVLNAVLNAFNNEFEHYYVDCAVRQLNACRIRQSKADRVTSIKYKIPGLPRMKFRVHQVRILWFIVTRWVLNSDMPGALVADEMGLGKDFYLSVSGNDM